MGQLSALFYKNWILYKRGLLGNILQIAIPIFFICFVIVVRKLDMPTEYPQQSYVSPPNPLYAFNLKDDGLNFKNCTAPNIIGLAPAGDPLVAKISLELTSLAKLYSVFASEADLQTYIRSQNYKFNPQICWALVVTSSTAGNYQYKLRFNISIDNTKTDGPLTKLKLTLDQQLDLNLYRSSVTHGMVKANLLANSMILQLASSDNNNYLENSIAPVYQNNYVLDNIYTNLGPQIGILALLPLLLIYLRQTSSMLSQKQGKVRESMSIMGMKLSGYYFSWFIRYLAVFAVMHIICSIIIARQLPSVPFYVPFIIFILFDILLIIQNFFIQVFLTRAKIGVVISLLFFIVQYIISFIATNSDNPTLSVNGAISIIPHCAFVLAFQTMIYSQSVKIDANFRDQMNYYVIGYALLSFILNIIFYLALTWYLDQVIPNEWGAKRHPLFCCFNKTAPYSLQQKEQKKRQLMSDPTYVSTHEPIDENLRSLERQNKMIQIVGLKKQFNEGETLAVKNLTISMYNNQIFALLGHNGAGKTTTISMLTGMIDPSDGYMSVFGETQLDKYRSMIGVCPQHDTLYEDLTVEEHIQLYSTFKGLQGDELKAEVNKLINDVNLSEKRDQYSKNLSGGQKRRLSVAIAFAGRSKVIILDEPTSGMDTSARRYIWQLLKSYKNDRVIILTTHFMDEADYLGDRIGIMGDGKMICCGSSIFLKNKFGVGYNITFVKDGNEVSSTKIIEVVHKYVPNAKVLSNVAIDLSMQLPLEDLPKFSAMFAEIDSKKEELKFAEYGISITTLQEVFLKVGEQLQNQHEKVRLEEIQLQKQHMSSPIESKLDSSPMKLPVDDQLQGEKTSGQFKQIHYDNIPREQSHFLQFCIHFKATFLKRLRVIKRDMKSFVFELILPILIIILALFLMRISFIKDLDPQAINLNTYLSQQNPVVVPIGSDVAGTATAMQTSLNSKYSTLISINKDTTNTAVAAFDQNTVFSSKMQTKTIKGGIFFQTATGTGAIIPTHVLYKYSVLVNTRSPTSYLFLPTLGAQTIINKLLGSTATTISVINHPLPRTFDQLQINNTIAGFLGGFIFSLALAFKFASIIAFIVKEREDRSKHQQIVSGMKLSAYWTANFVYDYVLYLIVAIVSVGIISGLQITSLTTGSAYTGTWLLFVLYGLAYISFTYIAAFLFKDYGNAQAGYYFLTFIIGGMFPILTLLLRILGTGSSAAGRGIAWIFRIYPAFAFGEGLINIGSVNFYSKIQNGGKSLGAMDLQVGLAPCIYLAVEAFLYFGLLFLIEALMKNETFMRCFTSQAEVSETKAIVEEDVLNQYRKAMAADPSEYQILTKNLRKVYSIDSAKKHKIAVDNLSFAVKKGQVFGLLGVNGAGKTTTFKMLAGQITSTAGDSYFNGLKISDNLDKVRQGLGYCPQFDALIDNLSVKEQLELFYDMKSLSSDYKEKAINKKIEEMNLGEYTDKLSGTLSGGNKRKLSVAMAMIGNPRIVFLDEPSTGMDPKARRFMWKVISRVATERHDSTVILTTHSMEEAEALSTRLGIMVKGNFQCIGTPQHIKSKYGQGFEIQIKLITLQKEQIQTVIANKKIASRRTLKKIEFQGFLDHIKAPPEDRLQISENGAGNYIYNILQASKQIQIFSVIQFLEVCRMSREVFECLAKAQFGQIQLLQKLSTFMRLKIKQKAKVSRIFDFFEKNKDRLGIQQYTIKQASVEQIFNHFAEIDEQTEYGP